MKKLYVTDLDGTLLQNDATLSENSIKKLNQIISDGGYFSFSSARSPASLSYFAENLNFNIPLILMNGAMIYDINTMKCINVEIVDKNCIEEILEIISTFSCRCHIYAYENDDIIIYNKEKEFDNVFEFTNNRTYIQKYKKVDYFKNLKDKNIFYFAFHDNRSIIEPLYSALSKRKDIIEFTYYKDTYIEDCWYLEIYSKNANKGNGVKFLKEFLNIDYVVSFGDNNNDLDMIKFSDKGIAVANAVDTLKEYADEIIGYNYDDAVSNYIFNDFYKKNE